LAERAFQNRLVLVDLELDPNRLEPDCVKVAHISISRRRSRNLSGSGRHVAAALLLGRC